MAYIIIPVVAGAETGVRPLHATEATVNPREHSMRNLVLVGAAAAALVAGSTQMSGRAEAATGMFDGIRVAAEPLGILDKAQFIYLGRRHCWYPDGWHGPGWYWCGYNWRRGLGWGGPEGWRGWQREERREEWRGRERREEWRGRERREERHEERREERPRGY